MRLRLYDVVARAISAFAPGNPRSRRRGSEYSVFDRREWMLDRGSTQPHRFWPHSFLHTIQHFLIQAAGEGIVARFLFKSQGDTPGVQQSQTPK
jgi:hypothetical protein